MLEKPNKHFRDWREYSQEELDAQYNQNSKVIDSSGYKEQKISKSAKARGDLDCVLDVSYGPSLAETLDIFPADKKGAPINIFIHGGAWKSGNKSQVSYPAPVFHDAGANYVALNFGEVPDVMLEEQVRQCRAAIAWVYGNAKSFGGDPDQIFVSGHSSGSHVTGMMVVTDWEGIYGLPADIIKGAAPISGMFDLEPVLHSWRNSYLKLDGERALALSAIHQIPDAEIALVLGVGSEELAEFQRQSSAFSDAWVVQGKACTLIEVPGRNHFEMGADFGDATSPVTQAIFEQMSL
ncbi:MAG: alpha/beta hydrolase [Rhodospirillales bacterium]|jgi:arylformamidase|nr:alpha/beta hydrolase [Rhodospirillales bacterium]MBT4005669.1 alpha/beta hydrolase [Rhodospirillales bacterium]MBT5075057.1 alpha/beta hydrolase [Rhodospirillales bacterium]MBT5113324.1 alpha/beta hydrolase [Rhodospirillales bacterium]MBT5672150.1 alpha/beta hydrolase [Rhodospirillales bacterium]